MKALFVISLMAVGIVSCSGPAVTPHTAMVHPETICYEDSILRETVGVESSDDGTNITSTTSSKITESNTEHCSNKPRIEHVLKDVGVVSECRDYYTSYRIKGRVRHVKGLLCKNGNGDWEAVNQRYSYFN